MANNNYTVYKHTTPDGRIYIGCTGQTLDKRWQRGIKYIHNKAFNEQIEKYGWDGIKHEIIAGDLTMKEATRLERILIRELDATNPEKGFNIQKGGVTNYEARCGLRIFHSGVAMPVCCVETGKMYPSIMEASRRTNIGQPSITNALKTGGTAGGFHWEAVKQ